MPALGSGGGGGGSTETGEGDMVKNELAAGRPLRLLSGDLSGRRPIRQSNVKLT